MKILLLIISGNLVDPNDDFNFCTTKLFALVIKYAFIIQ